MSEVLEESPDAVTMQRHLKAMKVEAARGSGQGRAGFRVAGVAVAAGFALVATLAGLGSLPAPAQQVMAEVAERVGITLPSPATDSLRGDPDVAKQRPTFDPPPGHAVRDQAPFRGSPKPEGWPGNGRPGSDTSRSARENAPGQDNAPGLDTAPGLDEAPGQDTAPGQTDNPGQGEDPDPPDDATGQDRETPPLPDRRPDQDPPPVEPGTPEPPGQGETPPGQTEDRPGNQPPTSPSGGTPASGGGQLSDAAGGGQG
jgi:hypothetical protein